DQPRLGHELAHPLRREWVEDVARARLANELAARARLVREVPAVPGLTARIVPIEVADLLPRRARDRRMASQVRVERGGAGLLGAEDQEIGQRPRGRGRAAVGPDRVPQ